jgi:hypothetical protein
MSVTRGREAAFFFSNYRIRVLRFLYGKRSLIGWVYLSSEVWDNFK